MRKNQVKKRKNIKLFLSITAAVAVIVVATYYFSSKGANDVVIATINNQKIYKSEIEKKINLVFSLNGQNGQIPQLESMPLEVIETFAKEIYFEKELLARAKKSDIMKQKNLHDRIKDAENKIITAAYLDAVIKEKITDEKLSEKYAEFTNETSGKKEILASHILVKSKNEADKIYQNLTDKKAKKRAKFSDLAKKYSLDKQSASKGGSLGLMNEENMPPEFSNAFSKMKKGDFSKPIQTKYGWHIVKYDEVKEVKPRAFEDVKASLREEIIRNETTELYNDIFKDSKVKILIEDKLKNNAQPQQRHDDVKNGVILKSKIIDNDQIKKDSNEEESKTGAK